MKNIIIVLGFAITGFACYSIGYQRGKMEWERGIERTFKDLMQKVHPGVPFKWEGYIGPEPAKREEEKDD